MGTERKKVPEPGSVERQAGAGSANAWGAGLKTPVWHVELCSSIDRKGNGGMGFTAVSGWAGI